MLFRSQVVNVTAHNPFETAGWTKGLEPKNIFNTAAELGADSYFVTHNHPSGISRPSDNDLKATRWIYRYGRYSEDVSPEARAMAFLGHVVTNHTEHHLIQAGGFTPAPVIQRVEYGSGVDPILGPHLLDRPLMTPHDLVRAAVDLGGAQSSVMVLFLDRQRQVRSMGEIVVRPDFMGKDYTLQDFANFRDQMLSFTKDIGGFTSVGYSTNPEHAKFVEKLVHRGILYDGYVTGQDATVQQAHIEARREPIMSGGFVSNSMPQDVRAFVTSDAKDAMPFSPSIKAEQSPEPGFYSKLEQVIQNEVKGKFVPAAQLKAIQIGRAHV